MRYWYFFFFFFLRKFPSVPVEIQFAVTLWSDSLFNLNSNKIEYSYLSLYSVYHIPEIIIISISVNKKPLILNMGIPN